MHEESATPSPDDLSIGVLTVAADGRIIYSNSAATALLGAISARPEPSIAAFGPMGSHLHELCRRVMRESRRVLEREVEAPTGLVDISLSPEAGDRILIEILPLEWHRTALAERQVERQHAALRAMLRGLAHELKNPLGGLRGAAQLLERRIQDAELAEFCSVIIAETDRLSEMIDRFATESSAAPEDQINVHAAMERVFQLLAPGDGVRIERDYDPSIPEIRGDLDALIQALLNLVKNAVEAHAQRIVLRSRIRRRGSEGGGEPSTWAALEVEDDGSGIPEELAELIYYPLVTGKDEGSGLGLSIAQSVATRHGGRLEFRSRPGRTVFTLYLPLEAADD